MPATVSIDGMIRIGTRGSALARWQAEWVGERLRGLNSRLRIDVVEIKTQGDRDRNSPLSSIGGIGLFTKEIQRAVCNGSVDVAVHSLKDLPTVGPDDLVLAAVPERDDVADALIAPEYRTLEGLPTGTELALAPQGDVHNCCFYVPTLKSCRSVAMSRPG